MGFEFFQSWKCVLWAPFHGVIGCLSAWIILSWFLRVTWRFFFRLNHFRVKSSWSAIIFRNGAAILGVGIFTLKPRAYFTSRFEVKKGDGSSSGGFKFTPNTEPNDVWFGKPGRASEGTGMHEDDTSSCRKSSQINDSEIYWIWYCPKRNIFIYGFGIFLSRLPFYFHQISCNPQLARSGEKSSHNINSIIRHRGEKIHGKLTFSKKLHMAKRIKVITHVGT